MSNPFQETSLRIFQVLDNPNLRHLLIFPMDAINFVLIVLSHTHAEKNVLEKW